MKIESEFSYSMLTDLYQLTMAYGFWKSGKADQGSCFHLFFRSLPFGSGYAICSGLGLVIEALRNYKFSQRDVDFLTTLQNPEGKPLFSVDFLEYLGNLEPSWDIDAVEEGSVVFAQQPVLRVVGSLPQCQMLESFLLNLFNFNSLVSTKASRICDAAGEAEVLEFGLRRAQGPNGALMASRAAFIGGCAATSNVMAGQVYDIPVRGTHSHSWVLSFDSEEQAFAEFAKRFPDNCVLLVDTYDTVEGIKNAIAIARQLPEPSKFLGVRLDSGDLAYFSQIARQLLDRGGFPQARIFAGNNLDEYIIESLRQQKANVSVWAVGTNLVTGKGQPAFGGVYKLSSLLTASGWQPKLKLSEDKEKINMPGHLQVRRFFQDGQPIGDVTYDLLTPPAGDRWNVVNPANPLQQRHFTKSDADQELLKPIYRSGRLVYSSPDIFAIRAKTRAELGKFDKSIKRFINPHQYPAGIERRTHDAQLRLIAELKNIKL